MCKNDSAGEYPMIVDMNMSVGHWPFRRLPVVDVAGLVGLMDLFGIGQGLVANLEGVLYKDVMAANASLRAQLAGCERRVVPQAVINPAFPGWERDLAICADEWGWGGVRLYPNYHGYALTDGCFGEFLAAADEKRLVVSVNVRMTDERMHHWRAMTPATEISALPDLAAAHRQARFIVNCANNGEVWPLAEGIRACGNVFAEVSHIEGPGGVGELAELIGFERVLLGTHAPYFYADSPRLKLDEAGIGGEERRMIEAGNAVRLLG